MTKGMTRWGVGPGLGLVAAAWLVPACALRYTWPDVFRFPWIPYAALAAVGAALVAGGIALLIAAAAPVGRAFGEGRLVTSGAYALCRHPLYAAWFLLLFPGAMLLTDSWIGLLGTPCLYVVLRRVVRREEAWLEERFGEAYRDYRRRTPALLPLGRLGRG